MKTRRELTPEGARRRLILIDSAALVAVTGSHGALFGNDSMNALKVDSAWPCSTMPEGEQEHCGHHRRRIQRAHRRRPLELGRTG